MVRPHGPVVSHAQTLFTALDVLHHQHAKVMAWACETTEQQPSSGQVCLGPSREVDPFNIIVWERTVVPSSLAVVESLAAFRSPLACSEVSSSLINFNFSYTSFSFSCYPLNFTA